MSKAIELAINELADEAAGNGNSQEWLDSQTSVIYEELRRLAAIEQKYKAIIEQEPVGYVSKDGLHDLNLCYSPCVTKHKWQDCSIALFLIDKD